MTKPHEEALSRSPPSAGCAREATAQLPSGAPAVVVVVAGRGCRLGR